MTRSIDSLIIRPETAADATAIHEVNALAFGRDDEARLVAALRASGAFIPDLSLVAAQQERVVGHVLFTQIAIQSPERSTPALALAPVAVRPELQRAGIGSRLIRRGLERARDLGHRLVIVLGHRAYYPRFGFAPANQRGITAPFPARDEAFMYLDLVPDASAGISGTVRYSAPFNAV